MFAYRQEFSDLKKKRKEGGRGYCLDEGVELLIFTKVFIYCKQNSRDAKYRNRRLSHFYRKLCD